MSTLYCNNGCPYEHIGRCPENGLPERCRIQAMYAELAAVKADHAAMKIKWHDAHDELKRVRAERDAAIADIKQSWVCRACKRRIPGDEWVRCDNHLFKRDADGVDYCDNFDWRSVQPEGSE